MTQEIKMESANYIQVLDKDGKPYVGKPVESYYTGLRIPINKNNIEHIKKFFNVSMELDNHFSAVPKVDPNINIDPNVVEFKIPKEWWDDKKPDDEDAKNWKWNWENYRRGKMKEIDKKNRKIKKLEDDVRVMKLEMKNVELKKEIDLLKRQNKYYKMANEVMSKEDKKEFEKQKKERDFYAMP